MMFYWSVKALKPNARVYATDACVPITKLAECIEFAEDEIRNCNLEGSDNRACWGRGISM